VLEIEQFSGTGIATTFDREEDMKTAMDGS